MEHLSFSNPFQQEAAQQQEREDELALARQKSEAVRLEEEAIERQQLQQASQLAERVASEEAATRTKEAAQQQER